MSVFERLPINSLPMSRDRWTPVFVQHGRMEVDDSSVRWISSENEVVPIPIATVSAIILGPGTTITHAAVKACAECKTPILWTADDGVKFYACGTPTGSDNKNALKQVAIYSNKKKRETVARKMFSLRFGDSQPIDGKSIQELMGMEGIRIRNLYSEMGVKYSVQWRGRKYGDNWDLSDTINKSISCANSCLYSIVMSVVSSMGFLPQIGFIHSTGQTPFVYDIADIYKPTTTIEAAFQVASVNENYNREFLIERFKEIFEENMLMKKIPKDIESILSLEEEK